jgi:hypothetical protein
MKKFGDLGGLESNISEEDIRAARNLARLAEEALSPRVLSSTTFDTGEKKGGIICNGPDVDQYSSRVINAFIFTFPHLAEILEMKLKPIRN